MTGRISRRGLLGLAALGAAGGCGVLGREPVAQAPAPSPSVTVTPPPFADAENPKKLGGTVPFVAGKAMLGSYLALDGMTYPEAVKHRRRQLGRDQRITHVFYAWPDRLPTVIEGMPKRSIPMVSWRGTRYARILDGRSDELIAASARRLRQWGRPVLLRWGWEMNGRWYEWGGPQNGNDPAGFVKSFRRLRKIFDGEGADNISWVWSPNWNSSPAAEWNRMEAYYPGDDYVDWVGVSGYNLNRESPDVLFDPVYDSYAARRPLMITEVGSKDHGGTSKADWIAEFSGYVAQRPAIGAVVWFDTDTHPSYPEHWRFDTNAEATAAYRAIFSR